MTIASTEKRVRRVCILLAALPVLFVGGIFWSDRFVAFDQSRTLSVHQALSEGLLQGFLGLNVVLFAAAVGLWRRQRWARWVATVWFPLLCVHNLGIELFITGSIQGQSWLHSILISTLWVASVGSVTFGPAASSYFRPGVDG